jgi:hypothetical protein
MATLNLLLSASSPLPYTQVKLRLHALLFWWCQEASFPTEHRGPALTSKPSCGRALTVPPESGNPALPLSGNLPFCGCQETCFPKAQKGPVLLTVPNHGRAHFSIKEQKHRFPIEGRKVETYYSVSVTRRTASQGAQRHSTLHCV